MKIRCLFIPFASVLLASPLSAEIFSLKDGSSLDAKILSETADEYLLEVQVTKSIKDERKIAKADVKNIEREKLDEKAFEKIKGLVPTPDLLVSDDYDKRILAVTMFLKNYPKSPRAAEATAILSTLKAEGVAILAGGLKIRGVVISAPDYKANAYEIDALVLETKIRRAAAAGDFLAALRGLTKIDQDFKATLSRSALAPLRRQILQEYQARISEQLATYDARVAVRKTGISRMSPEDRSNTEQALAEELALAERLYTAEQEQNQSWVTTHPFLKESLDTAAAEIEMAASETTTADAVGDGGKRYRDTWALIQTSSDRDAIRNMIDSTYEFQMPDWYISLLKEAAKVKGFRF